MNDQLQKDVDIFLRMLNELPADTSRLLAEQFQKIMRSMQEHHQSMGAKISESLDDIRLLAATMKFDLEATKAERDQLKKERGDEI